MTIRILPFYIKYYDEALALWNSFEISKPGLNPVDESRQGIERYLRRNPQTCFNAVSENEKLVGVILSGHDGRRGIIHHMCVDPEYQRHGIGTKLLNAAEEALHNEGIQKIFILVFNDNIKGNSGQKQVTHYGQI